MSNLDVQPSDAQDSLVRERIATELDRNFLVEAAAGTGKTTSLVNRMVALVASGKCRVQQVTAVTFTRKAAAELRERFQGELRRRALVGRDSEQTDPIETRRLTEAVDYVNQAFVGTIHSFCAALLRERPIEFGVDPSFRELDESEDKLLREQAWYENISDLMASDDPLIKKLQELDLERSRLKDCYDRFIEYRDIEDWPSSIPPEIDLEELKRVTRAYIDDMQQLVPRFPPERGNDELMNRYDEIVRASSRSWHTLGRFFSLLERFDSTLKVVQKVWRAADGGSSQQGKENEVRWKAFRSLHAKPALHYWCRLRYTFVVDFVRRAVKAYERLKRASGGLDFQDLLLTVARGLRSQPELRRYFQTRYSHLLVDEFQDTDPIQAEMMLYLTSSNIDEPDWTKCVPKPGSLFLVGDPKQSIYRFRRGDIVTFNRVKAIITASSGETLALAKNFRSRKDLIEWNNRIYQGKFGQAGSQYSPVAEDMLCGRQDALSPRDAVDELRGVYRLDLPSDVKIEQVHELEAESIARFIRHAIDSGKQIYRTERERQLGRTTSVRAGDFLIVPWGKKCINLAVAALEKVGIPYEVSGGNPLSNNLQLSVLIDCLRAIDDPSNPVAYLAMLREFFGLSDRDLYLFKQAGGRFNYSAAMPGCGTHQATGPDKKQYDGLTTRLQGIATRFQNYQRWLRSLPYAAAVSRIGEDLGLFAAAAASSEGNMQAGGLFKAIEWVREQSWDFDSATDLIHFLDEILVAEDTDGCPALPPDENVVRIMNLHKAKGLEAPIVFLADTSSKYGGDVRCHIDRSGPGAVGYMGITARKGQYQMKEVATPENWKSLQDEEQRFLDAEANRLLYVATTRAGCALIVSTAKDNSNWGSLYPYLQDAPKLEIPETVSTPEPRPAPIAANAVSPEPIEPIEPIELIELIEQIEPIEQIAAKWSAALEPSYAVTTSKKLGLKGKSRPKWEVSGDYGHLWGSAVHELLEVCHKAPGVDLRPTALRLAKDYNLEADRVDELISTVQAVTRSAIWQRAQRATRCYSELPFETLTINAHGTPTLIRGVIDLIFEEPATPVTPASWIIVDYKTDDIKEADIPSAVEYYRWQLLEYSQRWSDTTGNPTKELGLYFTKLDRYESLDVTTL